MVVDKVPLVLLLLITTLVYPNQSFSFTNCIPVLIVSSNSGKINNFKTVFKKSY